MLALLRLGLLHKRVLLFVNGIDAGLRLRLFLEAFGVRAAVLNAELPANSRHHILQVSSPAPSPAAYCFCLLERYSLTSLNTLQHAGMLLGLIRCEQSDPS